MEIGDTIYKTKNSSLFSKLFTLETAKTLGSLMVLSVLLYQLEHVEDDALCKEVLASGKYEEERWQPDGCNLHKYNQSDAMGCFEVRDNTLHIALVGDSRMRQVYLALEGFIQGIETGENEDAKGHQMYMQLRDDEKKFNVEYFYLRTLDADVERFEILKGWVAKNAAVPDIILIGFATHYPYLYGKEEGLKIYHKDLLELREESVLDEIIERHETKIIWKMQPLVLDEHPTNMRKNISCDILTRHNAIVNDILQNSSVQIWSSIILMIGREEMIKKDGIHYTLDSVQSIVNVLLNTLCNGHVNLEDETCCSNLPRLINRQIVIPILSMLPGALVVAYDLLMRSKVTSSDCSLLGRAMMRLAFVASCVYIVNITDLRSVLVFIPYHLILNTFFVFFILVNFAHDVYEILRILSQMLLQKEKLRIHGLWISVVLFVGVGFYSNKLL